MTTTFQPHESILGCSTLNTLTINLKHIQDNLAAIKQKYLPGARIMVIIKASSYGTNALEMSKNLIEMGVDILGVAHIEEAITLRKQGITVPIFVTHVPIFELSKVPTWDVEVALSDKDSIEALAAESSLQNKVSQVHLHINTGMNRFGCPPAEAVNLAQHIKSYEHLHLIGVMSHFHSADDPESDAESYVQLQCFLDVLNQIEQRDISIPWRHIANTSALSRLHFPAACNMARIGLGLYGVHVSEDAKNKFPLKLALTLTSRLTEIRYCSQNETVSYGANYVVSREKEKIGVVPIGYHDGIHRCYSGKGYCLIRGRKAPYVGNICMDNMMVDITHIPDATLGDPVTLFGYDEYGNVITPEELAALGGTISHELLACLGPRLVRVFS